MLAGVSLWTLDLRPLWNWNVKQAFMWIAVDFPTPSRVSTRQYRAPRQHRPPQLLPSCSWYTLVAVYCAESQRHSLVGRRHSQQGRLAGTAEGHASRVPAHRRAEGAQVGTTHAHSAYQRLTIAPRLIARCGGCDWLCRGRTLNVTVGWDLMPIVGVLRHGGGSAHNSYQITLPSSYQ